MNIPTLSFLEILLLSVLALNTAILFSVTWIFNHYLNIQDREFQERNDPFHPN